MPPAPLDVHLETVGRLTAVQVDAVRRLVDAATDVDGVRPLSEHVSLHLRHGGDEPARNIMLWQGSELVGYAHLDVTDQVEGPSAELVVHPGRRRHGYGRALVDEALVRSGGHLRLWAHGELDDARQMAERLGFRRVRALWQMRRSLNAPLAAPVFPDGVDVRTFVPGSDDQAWLALNARAFADHPEQGAWTLEDLHRRIAEHWFDAAGFFLAERDGRLLGFHWTKVHGALTHTHPTAEAAGRTDPDAPERGSHAHDHAHEPIGEVYVVGVDPDAQGLGLGRALTLVGLRHLRAAGLQQVMLYVEETNRSAIGLYESLGFSRWDTDVLYRRG